MDRHFFPAKPRKVKENCSKEEEHLDGVHKITVKSQNVMVKPFKYAQQQFWRFEI